MICELYHLFLHVLQMITLSHHLIHKVIGVAMRRQVSEAPLTYLAYDFFIKNREVNKRNQLNRSFKYEGYIQQ